MRSSGNPSSTSSLVSARPLIPPTLTAWRTRTASNQPQRRRRPVLVPYSLPRSPSNCPVASASSVGNGPAPTRVLYAFAMPSTNPTAAGPTPAPAAAVAATVLLDVTYG